MAIYISNDQLESSMFEFSSGILSYNSHTGSLSYVDSIKCEILEQMGPFENFKMIKEEYIQGDHFYAVTNYRTMTIHSLHSDRNTAKAGSRTYTYNKHNWDLWRAAAEEGGSNG